MASSQDVVFPSGNRTLRGTAFAPEGGRPGDAALLFVHGMGSSQAGFLHRAAAASDALRARCLTFDLSGHGVDHARPEAYSVYDHLDDVIAAHDYLMTRAGPSPMRIGVCGASYGAYLAALLSAHRAVQRLLLRAPAAARDVHHPTPDKASDAYVSGDLPPLDSFAALSRFAGDVLILESEIDCRIPHSQILEYLAACPQAEHEVIPGAGHALTDPAWDAAFVDAILRWFHDL